MTLCVYWYTLLFYISSIWIFLDSQSCFNTIHRLFYFVLGGIGIGATGALTLSAKMNGIWENAFGIQYISFGNMAFSIGIIPGVSVTEFGIDLLFSS